LQGFDGIKDEAWSGYGREGVDWKGLHGGNKEDKATGEVECMKSLREKYF